MSRRAPNPAQERIAQNQQTIKSLLKLDCNKVCADCKRNKHPRWASWNIGIFICIRCSGIHRSMGTHISRVKSVDLDSWTDEQVASVLAWGNSRANKYWESKLAAGHVPSESKIENFIRTKYELKRWTMDGPRPDPSSLDADGDEDIPLSLVKEKHNIERKESLRKASIGQTSAPASRKVAPLPTVDLIGGDPPSLAPSSSSSPAPPKANIKSAPKPTNAKDSLLGFDFMGDVSSTPQRPASTSTTGSGGTQSRPDLKQSILSLYATAPRPQVPQQPAAGGFGGMGSPTHHHHQPSLGSMNDAFGGLSFGSSSSPVTAAAPAPPKPVDPFASFGFGASKSPTPSNTSGTNSNGGSFGGLGGGSFFDTKPAAAPSHAPKQPSFGGFGDFASSASAAPKPSTSAMGDLFNLSTPSPTAPVAPAMTSPPVANSSSFNLTASAPKAPAAVPAAIGGNAWSGSDVWGNNAWGSEVKAEPAKPVISAPTNDFGWGSSFSSTPIVPGSTGGFSVAGKPATAAAAAMVPADDEFGGWASSTPAASGSTAAGGKGFGASNDPDLFSNVWQ